jgi:hypothetical protein
LIVHRTHLPVFIGILNSTIATEVFLDRPPLLLSRADKLLLYYNPIQLFRPFVHVFIGTDNQIITYPIDKRFGLIISSDNLIIIFPIGKPFGLLEWIRGWGCSGTE